MTDSPFFGRFSVKAKIKPERGSKSPIGIWSGVGYEIVGQIQAYQEKYPQIEVFVCGGDAQSFDSLVKDHIFVVPNLVLHGLNAILNHNVE